MPMVVFRSPEGARIENPSEDFMKTLFLSPSNDYWRRGSGDACLEFGHGDSRKKLLILPSDSFCVYLKYIEGQNTWLSLQDSNRLKEMLECSDEWHASAGLFLPKEKAWLAIKEFSRTGTRCDQIQWIRPSELPEEGSW